MGSANKDYCKLSKCKTGIRESKKEQISKIKIS